MFERLVEKTRLWTRRVALLLFGSSGLQITPKRAKHRHFSFSLKSRFACFLVLDVVSLTQQFCLLVVGEHSILSFWRDDVNYIPTHLNFGPDVTILYNGI